MLKLGKKVGGVKEIYGVDVIVYDLGGGGNGGGEGLD